MYYTGKVGPYFRDIRIKRAVRMEDVSKETGVVLNTISRIERGHTKENIQDIVKMADLFGISPEQVFKIVRGYS